jgi:hypothetical protein
MRRSDYNGVDIGRLSRDAKIGRRPRPSNFGSALLQRIDREQRLMAESGDGSSPFPPD